MLSVSPNSKICQRIIVDAIIQALLLSPASTTTTTATSPYSSPSYSSSSPPWSTREMLEYLTCIHSSLEHRFFLHLFIACRPNLQLSEHLPEGGNSNLPSIIPYFIEYIDRKLKLLLQNSGANTCTHTYIAEHLMRIHTYLQTCD